MERPTDSAAPDGAIAELFACLERGTCDSRLAEPSDSTRPGSTTATTPGLAETLEDQLARLFCLAVRDGAEALKPASASARGAWTHTSGAGSRLVIACKKGALASLRVLGADGTLAAEATPRAGTSAARPRLRVALFHDDGVSLLRDGEFASETPWSDPETLHLARDRWWLDRSTDGRIVRARYFASRSLLAEHGYAQDAPAVDVEDALAPRSFDALLAEALRIAGQTPTRARFLELCRRVERAATRDRHRTVRELVPALHDRVEGWPAKLRMAPLLWINRLVRGQLPLEALHLVSAISLSAALWGHYLASPHYPLLVAWLREYPSDGPAVDGLSISLAAPMVEALQAACRAEPDASLHPHGELESGVEETFHVDSADWPVILGAALWRELRVFDASCDPVTRDFDWDMQGILNARGLTVGTVLRQVSSSRLAVVNLHGQCATPRDPLGLKSASRLRERAAKLEVLELGGGHPLGDEALRQIASLCPALHTLSVSPGVAGTVLSDYDFDEWDPTEGRDSVYGRLSEHWNIYGNEDLARMRATPRGWRALGKLAHLRRLVVGPMHHLAAMGPPVVVETGDLWGPPTPLAAWDATFDL